MMLKQSNTIFFRPAHDVTVFVRAVNFLYNYQQVQFTVSNMK